MTFYNTTNETGSRLQKAVARTERQEDRILNFMRLNSDKWFTAEEIEKFFIIPRASVSRAMANLTKAGRVEKSETADWMSSYGVSCYGWRVPKGQTELFG